MDLNDYRQCLRRWSAAVHAMYSQCHLLGPRICLPVHYEHLVLHPETSMRKILDFLDLPWNASVLHHELLVGKPGGVSLSILERSTDQVIKPINTEALTKWVGRLPEDVVRDMPSLAPMLAILGYDPRANPPDYGQPDSLVIKNTWDLKANKKVWEAREKLVAEKRDNIWRSWLQKSKSKSKSSVPKNSTEMTYQTTNDRWQKLVGVTNSSVFSTRS
ncbi:Protein-tyrosine sulfotransferase, partial [Stegodyphus mimosarum]